MPPLRTDVSDGALIERTRRGDRAAYAELWRRHAASARTVARSYSSLDADDLVAESFTKIYDAILGGGGPTSAFRPYLFTTLRNTAASWGRGRRETTLETLESLEDPASSEAATLDALDRSTTAQAFRSLPTRWQEVLWYSEVEGMGPQQIAPLVGMSANATAALAYRAREGLRQAWIRVHLRTAEGEPACRWTIDRLGGYTRGKLRARDTAKVEAHLDDCARCTIVAAEAREVGSRLALVLLPLTAGVGGATAYSAWLSQGAPAVDVAIGAGVPAVLVGAPGVGSWGGTSAAGGSAGGASGAGGSAGGASAAGGSGAGGSIGASGIAVGAGVGTLVIAAAAVAVLIAVPNLTAANEAPPAAIAGPAIDTQAAPPQAPPPSVVPPPPDAPVEAEAQAPDTPPPSVSSPPASDAPPTAAPVPAPSPGPEPDPDPEPVDDVLPAPSFSADTAGGLVDPLLTGTAAAGANVVVTADDGRSWATTADATGAWSLVADDLPAGTTLLTAAQADATGEVSSASEPIAIDLSAPGLAVRRSGHLVWHATFAGVPGASVEMLLGDSSLIIVELDDSGSAKTIALAGGDELADATVRYTAGGRTGPAAAAVVEPR
ncbi:sigma-70 family RNA polymerase sigma factor [Agromyces sp. H66]|uniref:sigma-70 family RNA polymerase sigma factor n=1 Tax=Agromyces sp. H66 TaxID=2529859 RepID=UPI0010A9C202|nr:sigma-70 family RNA polymerase sigma factor [Agromyces sp. H66]